MKISETLKKARLSLNLSQSQMAKELGVSIVTYNKIETGRKDLSIQTIEKIHNYTGLDYNEIRNNL